MEVTNVISKEQQLKRQFILCYWLPKTQPITYVGALPVYAPARPTFFSVMVLGSNQDEPHNENIL